MKLTTSTPSIQTSIIVPTFNGDCRIEHTLSYLIPHLTPERELIIIDDGSHDKTAPILRSMLSHIRNASLYSIQNKGRAGARNFGAEHARGSFIIFLDDDIEVSDTFIKRMEYNHSLQPRAWITGTVKQKIVPIPHSDFLRFRARLDYIVKGEETDGKDLVEVMSFTTQQLGVGKDFFLSLGGFRQDLKDSEDFELSLRVKNRDFKILHDKNNIVFHADFPDFRQTIKRQSEYLTGRLNLVRKLPAIKDSNPSFFQCHKQSRLKALCRKPFVYSLFWRTLFQSRVRFLIPERVRFLLYDYVLSSTRLNDYKLITENKATKR